MIVANLPASNIEFAIESENWATHRSLPRLDDATAEDLLRKTQHELIVPLRYGMSPECVFLIGELPLSPHHESWETDDSIDRDPQEAAMVALQLWLKGSFDTSARVDNETVECALTEMGHECDRARGHLDTPGNRTLKMELSISLVPRGLRVEGRTARLR